MNTNQETVFTVTTSNKKVSFELTAAQRAEASFALRQRIEWLERRQGGYYENASWLQDARNAEAIIDGADK
ncbi:MAG TPA: hypothetical protein VJ577_11320 [Burkholderiaceae bacterium]|nr:hypothetical protein [Burkholderiaceae bacterium]